LSDANKVNHIYENLVQSNQELNLQLNAIKQTLKNEEECIFNFIQIISEIELELELLGRNQKTLNHAITKLSSNFDIFSPTQDCLVCLKYLLLQLYKNQLKSSLLLPDFGSISANVSQNTHDQHYDQSHYKSNKIDDKISYQKQVVSQLQNRSNINTMEDWASHSLDKTLIDDIDVESINYILINRSVNHNIDK